MAGRTGYTKVQNTDPMQGPQQITGVYEHFDPLIGASANTRSALPVTNNWPGRTVFLTDIKRLMVWDEVGWYLVDGTCSGAVTVTLLGSSPPYQGEVDILFPVGLYSDPPSVNATPASASTAAMHVALVDVTKDGAKLSYTRATNQPTILHWMAVGR